MLPPTRVPGAPACPALSTSTDGAPCTYFWGGLQQAASLLLPLQPLRLSSHAESYCPLAPLPFSLPFFCLSPAALSPLSREPCPCPPHSLQNLKPRAAMTYNCWLPIVCLLTQLLEAPRTLAQKRSSEAPPRNASSPL